MDVQRIEEIENYLQGKLSKKKQEVFESRLNQDSKLKEEVALHQKMMRGLQELSFREELDKAYSDRHGKSKGRSNWRNKKSISIAASIVFMIVAVWLLYPENGSSLEKELVEVSYDPGLPTSLGLSDQLDFGEGMNAYKTKDYKQAKSYWQPLLVENPSNDTLLYYLAQIELIEKQFEPAAEKLRAIGQEKASVFKEKATWYLAISYLRMNKQEEAKVLLNYILTEGGYEAEKAGVLLDHLQEK